MGHSVPGMLRHSRATPQKQNYSLSWLAVCRTSRYKYPLPPQPLCNQTAISSCIDIVSSMRSSHSSFSRSDLGCSKLSEKLALRSWGQAPVLSPCSASFANEAWKSSGEAAMLHSLSGVGVQGSNLAKGFKTVRWSILLSGVAASLS